MRRLSANVLETLAHSNLENGVDREESVNGVQDGLSSFANYLAKLAKPRQADRHSRLAPEEEKYNRLVEVIRIYKGISDEDDDDGEKPWVDRDQFDVGMSIVIVLNTFVIGLETDLSDRNGPREWYWVVLEFIFAAIFVSEVVVKVRVHSWRWVFDGIMNLLTMLIALSAAIDFAVLYPLSATGIMRSRGVLRMLSLFRITGLLRLVRLIRHFKALEELRLVLQGMIESSQTIMWIVILIVVFLYISAIVTTKVIGQNVDVYGNYKKLSGGWDHEEYFGTVGRSMGTLLQVMTLDSWSSKVARHVVANQWYMSAFFLAFLLLSTHGLLNVVVSVIVEHTLSAAQSTEVRMQVREERAKKQELEAIQEIFRMADEDCNDMVELEEFMEACKSPEVQWRLNQLGLPATDAMRLFGVIDGAGSRALSVKEFISGCTRLKGLAQSKDLLAIQAQADTLASQMQGLSATLAETERMMTALDEVTLRISRRFGPAVRGTRQKIAHTKGGTEPVVPPPKKMKTNTADDALCFGNRPALPSFPNLLN